MGLAKLVTGSEISQTPQDGEKARGIPFLETISPYRRWRLLRRIVGVIRGTMVSVGMRGSAIATVKTLERETVIGCNKTSRRKAESPVLRKTSGARFVFATLSLKARRSLEM